MNSARSPSSTCADVLARAQSVRDGVWICQEQPAHIRDRRTTRSSTRSTSAFTRSCAREWSDSTCTASTNKIMRIMENENNKENEENKDFDANIKRGNLNATSKKRSSHPQPNFQNKWLVLCEFPLIMLVIFFKPLMDTLQHN